MKSQFHSKTVWFAVLTAALASLNYLYSEVTDPRVLSAILVCVAVVTYALRRVTNTAIR